MSTVKLAKEETRDKVGVHISKETGGASADVREVIKSELLRIRNENAHKATSNGKCESNSHKNNGK